jgi:3-deoxy-manno-octulosonate cytidylyltransferase (CMP-KDO synthetase)
MNPIILIPARMASTRLPSKPMADIGGAPMIVQVWRRVVQSFSGTVVVACDHAEIGSAIEREGGRAVMTDPDLPSGSDRIYAALQTIDPHKAHDIIVNVQGDMPTLDLSLVSQVLKLMENPQVDIGTLAAPITQVREMEDPAVVKVALAQSGKALYFSRATIPYGEGPRYHHIGIYAYRRGALERFVTLPPSPLEEREKLEQLRALEVGMQIHVAVVDAVPLGVDTQETLDIARRWYEQANK